MLSKTKIVLSGVPISPPTTAKSASAPIRELVEEKAAVRAR